MQRYVLIPKSQREGRSSFTGKEEIISPVLPHSWLHPYRESGAPFVSYPLTALYRKEFPTTFHLPFKVTVTGISPLSLPIHGRE